MKFDTVSDAKMSIFKYLSRNFSNFSQTFQILLKMLNRAGRKNFVTFDECDRRSDENSKKF